MLSYAKWKIVNESFVSRTLGLSQHQSLGLISPIHTEVKSTEEPATKDGEQGVIAEKKHDKHNKKCKYCGSMMKKEDVDMEDEDDFEDEDGYEDEEEEEEEEEEYEDEDENEEEDEEEDEEDYDDEEDEDYEESKKHMGKCMKCMKNMKHMKHMKHMGKCMKCMKNESSLEDAMVEKLVKKGLPEKLAKMAAKKKFAKMKHKKNESSEDSWMNGIFGNSPEVKHYDGIS